jgi:ribose transport system ATP-binding protein
VTIRGRAARVGSPAEARRSGLVPVYQEPSLIPDLDVADNLRLGARRSRRVPPLDGGARHADLPLDAMIRGGCRSRRCASSTSPARSRAGPMCFSSTR